MSIIRRFKQFFYEYKIQMIQKLFLTLNNVAHKSSLVQLFNFEVFCNSLKNMNEGKQKIHGIISKMPTSYICKHLLHTNA